MQPRATALRRKKRPGNVWNMGTASGFVMNLLRLQAATFLTECTGVTPGFGFPAGPGRFHAGNLQSTYACVLDDLMTSSAEAVGQAIAAHHCAKVPAR